MKHVDYGEVLSLFDLPSRPLPRSVLGDLLLGYDRIGELRRAERFIGRLEAQKLISRTGRLRDAFTITAAGTERRRELQPRSAWQRPWDGTWRVLTFDLPMVRQRDRRRLWQALRDRRLGMLQRSVWIWPHELQPILLEIMEVEGLPECFCGFNVSSLFLCTTAEVVATAWRWEEIHRRHQTYRQNCVAREDDLDGVHDLPALTRIARVERVAYSYAFTMDPLLPRALWPRNYTGEDVETRHQSFRQSLRRRFQALTA